MSLLLSDEQIRTIRTAYEKKIGSYPKKKEELAAFFMQLQAQKEKAAAEEEILCLQFLYAFMPITDIVTYSADEIDAYVKASLAMRETISYAKEVPSELFLSYVLSIRINNENLDGSRVWMFEELCSRVQNKTMTEAALEVNYWCYEKATYIPADGRTISPSGMCRRAKGRCGEESTLAAAALRSVGIPARQCYVPRWAHCDDNHAWVEFWADGSWKYLGACEPEPVPNRGWFTAAASKSMLVHAKAYSHLLNGELPAYQTPLYSLINSTSVYADTVRVCVTVQKDQKPVSDVPVRFQLINYSELFTLYEEKTNERGQAFFLTGKGDLYVTAFRDSLIVSAKVDARKNAELILNLEDGWDPKTTGCATEEIDLIPPRETVPGRNAASVEEHAARLKQCEAVRADYESHFLTDFHAEGDADAASWKQWFINACGNYEELKAFYESAEASMHDKELLLSTLREKDFADFSCADLLEYLKEAAPFRTKISEELFRDAVLAPRIANEMLTCCRKKTRELAEAAGLGRHSLEADILSFMKKQLTVCENEGIGGWSADAAAFLTQGICQKQDLPVLFVQICRSVGIPARLNPVTGEAEAIWLPGIRKEQAFSQVSFEENKTAEPMISLKLKNTGSETLEYMLHFTLGRYENGSFTTLNFWGTKVEKEVTLQIPPGTYRLITTTRQIDGSVSAYLLYFQAQVNGQTVPLILREDKTAEKRKFVELPDTLVEVLSDARVSNGADGREAADKAARQVSLKSLYTKDPESDGTVLICADPGKEPTEHLFQEILECQKLYLDRKIRIVVLLSDDEGLKQPTFARVIKSGLDLAAAICRDESWMYEMHEVFAVGDERLPFAAAIDKEERGLFAFSNYNIRSAWTLLKLLQ